MSRIVVCTALAIAFVAVNAPAQAKGCIKGAIVGGAAGHVAGHHGVLGAVAGCVIGHHEANKQQPAQPSTTGSAPK
jgi:outer membrane lipoprotein SlyB